MSNPIKKEYGNNSTNLVKYEPVDCSSHSNEEENIGEISNAKQEKLH